MIKTTFTLFIFSFISFNILGQQKNELKEITKFGNNSGNLKMFKFDNSFKTDTALKPLVIVLHGCGQSAKDVAALTGWNKLAVLHNFEIVYPQQKTINNISHCFNWFNKKDIEKDKGEASSIKEMIDYMKLNFKIDSSKIFITGISAGAAMGVVMLANYPSTFKSGAIFAGCAYKIAENPLEAFAVMAGNKKIVTEKLVEKITNQNPSYAGDYPTLIIYQGLKDVVVQPKNANVLITQWTALHQTDSIADYTSQNYLGIKDITKKEFQNSAKKVIVTYYEIGNIGHQLLINPGDGKDEGGKKGVFGVDKDFHSTYFVAKEFGIIKE